MMPSACLLAIILGFNAADIVVPRGGSDPIRCTVSRVDDDGVRFRPLAASDGERAPEIVLSWDRVADVRIAGPVQPRLPELLVRADRLFRAGSRLDRADMANAEPILELEFPGMIGRTSETALFIADGLLRCRLDRGALSEAIEPALEYARLRQAGITTVQDDRRIPPTIAPQDIEGVVQMWDPDFGLVPFMPPAWLDGPALEVAMSRLAQRQAVPDSEQETIGSLYRLSMQLERGETVDPVDLDSESIADRPGPLLMALMVNAVHPDAAVRKDARDRLENRPPTDPPWVDAWIRFQLGRSYLMEPGSGQRRKGMLSFARIIAVSSEAQPYLSGMAMAIMADQFEQMGDLDAAERLRADLRRATPRHPVLRATYPMPTASRVGDGKENP